MPKLATMRRIWIAAVSFGIGLVIGLKWELISEKLRYAGSLFN